MKCIFCNIVKKSVPSKILYESDLSIAFLDIEQSSKYSLRILFIPKKHYENIYSFPSYEFGNFMIEMKKYVTSIRNKYNNCIIANRNGEKAGQEVFHIHFHILANILEKIYF